MVVQNNLSEELLLLLLRSYDKLIVFWADDEREVQRMMSNCVMEILKKYKTLSDKFIADILLDLDPDYVENDVFHYLISNYQLCEESQRFMIENIDYCEELLLKHQKISDAFLIKYSDRMEEKSILNATHLSQDQKTKALFIRDIKDRDIKRLRNYSVEVARELYDEIVFEIDLDALDLRMDGNRLKSTQTYRSNSGTYELQLYHSEQCDNCELHESIYTVTCDITDIKQSYHIKCDDTIISLVPKSAQVNSFA